MTDPLLTFVGARSGSFFWDDVIDRRSLTGPARDMFERAEAGGISSGFVVSRRCKGLDPDRLDDGRASGSSKPDRMGGA